MLSESPCRSIEGKARMREAVDLPISEHTGGFSHAIEFVNKAAVDIFNVTVVSAGIRHAMKISARAEAFGIKMLIGTTQELSIGHRRTVAPRCNSAKPRIPLLLRRVDGYM